MRIWPAISIASAAVAALTGCGPALQPFYSPGDLYQEPRLEGRWVHENETHGSDTIQIRHAGDGNYSICDDDCKDPAPAALFRLGGILFLDFQESKNQLTSAVYPHGVLRVRLMDDAAEVTPLDEEALKEMARQGELNLSHTVVGSRFLVTAPTEKLRQFLIRHASDPKVWGESETYQKVQ